MKSSASELGLINFIDNLQYSDCFRDTLNQSSMVYDT